MLTLISIFLKNYCFNPNLQNITGNSIHTKFFNSHCYDNIKFLLSILDQKEKTSTPKNKDQRNVWKVIKEILKILFWSIYLKKVRCVPIISKSNFDFLILIFYHNLTQ